MDDADLGDGWVDVTGTREGSTGPRSETMRWQKAGISLGGVLLQRAGLEQGDRVRVMVNTEKQMVRIVRCQDGEATGNKISKSGKYSGMVSAAQARKMVDVDLPQELEVLAVEDGDIVGGYT